MTFGEKQSLRAMTKKQLVNVAKPVTRLLFELIQHVIF